MSIGNLSACSGQNLRGMSFGQDSGSDGTESREGFRDLWAGVRVRVKHLAIILGAVMMAFGAGVRGGDGGEGGQEKGGGLPLTEIILYSSGVGYFQRDGQVEGRRQIDFRFKAEDINDLLKSMVVQDLDGGRVTTVTYGSRDPITKTLKSFGIDLTPNPSLGQLLGQVRGEGAEVYWPNRITGVIVGVEKKTQLVDEKRTVETEHLNLLTDEGLQSVALAQVQRIKLLDEGLNRELRQALEVLATSHDTQKKTVGVTFEGEGKRRVSVAYITQTPVWKTSYRLVLDEKEKPFLQGWAIVENTSDEDWNGVRLSLVSGRPISFMMDLYQPLYATRPTVEPELYSSLRPQVYGDAVELARGAETLRRRAAGLQAGVAPAAVPAAAAAESLALGKGVARTAAGLASADAFYRKVELDQGVAAAAAGGPAGELFQYAITTPVTLARQKSAMLPIVSSAVDGEKLSIYNATVQAKHPLNGFRLKNTTALHLMQGPITVFDTGTYAGDARIEDLAPSQDRLLSYALDLKTEVEAQKGEGQETLTSVQLRKGTLVMSRRAVEERKYAIRNRDQKEKTVLIEHPFRSDWKLVSPKEAAERTRDVHRFKVSVSPNKTEHLAVKEERQIEERVEITNFDNDSLVYYIRAKEVSGPVKEALRKVVELRDRINQTAAERQRREQRVGEITQEQSRIRENMARLSQSSELYGRYVKKFDQQEDELEKLRQEIEGLKNAESKQQRELNDYLLQLDVE